MLTNAAAAALGTAAAVTGSGRGEPVAVEDGDVIARAVSHALAFQVKFDDAAGAVRGRRVQLAVDRDHRLHRARQGLEHFF